ncbi:MAG: DMT family transporter [Pseudomonadota bacterium]
MTALAQRWAGLPAAVQGPLLMTVATLFLGMMDTTVKWLSTSYEPLFIVWARYMSQAVAVALVFAPSLRSVMRTQRLGLQVMRSGFLFVATMLFFTGLSLMPLADVHAIAQTAPLMITGMAALILGEKVGPWRWLGVGLGFLGALIVIRPGSGLFGWAALLPIGASVAFAALNIATRFLGRDESVWTTFFYTGLVGAAGASLIVPFAWQTPEMADVPLLILAGLFGAVGQLFLILALSAAPAAIVAPFNYTALLWAIAFGAFVFGTVPDHWTLLGAAVIVGAGLFVQWRERLAARRTAARVV